VPGLGPAPNYFSLLRQREVGKRKASRRPGRCAVPCAARTKRGRAELACGSNKPRPFPLASALLSPATRLKWIQTSPGTNAFADEVTRPCRHALASSAGPDGSGRPLSEAIAEFRPIPSGPSNAVCPQHRCGTAHPARLFFAYFLLAKQKKVRRPPGRNPARPASKNT
jgi:hypothetical protein